MAARIATIRMGASLRTCSFAGLVNANLRQLWHSPVKVGIIRRQVRHNATAAATVQPLQSSHPSLPRSPQIRPQLQQQQHHDEHREQLNILERAYEPSYYSTIAKIMKWRKSYLKERFIFVPHEEMEDLLRGFGAVDEDFMRLQLVSENLYSDPTLPFRKSRNGRFCIDFDTSSIRRLEFQPFALSLEEDFKRYDSDTVRVFDELQNELQLNVAFQGLMLFKAIMIHDMPTNPRPKLNYTINKWVCTLFNLRTVTKRGTLGEPALEGVHTDGVDHTMTTYLGSKNMTHDSAVTLLHDCAEKTGIPFQETAPGYIRARMQHRKFLDTLLLTDFEYKHSLSPVYAVNESKEATRDMLIFFTRKPVVGDHISASIDSLNPHKELPMEVPIFSPRRN